MAKASDGQILVGGFRVYPNQVLNITGLTKYTFDLPKALPDGEYLVRIEQIGLTVSTFLHPTHLLMPCRTLIRSEVLITSCPVLK